MDKSNTNTIPDARDNTQPVGPIMFSGKFILRHNKKLEWKRMHGSELAKDPNWAGILIIEYAFFTGRREDWILAFRNRKGQRRYYGYDGYHKSTGKPNCRNGKPMNLPLSDSISVYYDSTIGPRKQGLLLALNYSYQYRRFWGKYMDTFLGKTQQPPTSFYQRKLPPNWTPRSGYWPGQALRGSGAWLMHTLEFPKPIHFKEVDAFK